MHHLDTIDGIIALAETGPGVEPGEALNVLARIISDMDPKEAHYKERVAGLVLVGATLWRTSIAAGNATVDSALWRA
ncbi:hypothetical protein [Delftia tsuruhatensis]|uniref:hypothetical protein n=1 Tax=Delftia tsuruhatensis TaxID=180282 RepID=UPI0031DFFA71